MASTSGVLRSSKMVYICERSVEQSPESNLKSRGGIDHLLFFFFATKIM